MENGEHRMGGLSSLLNRDVLVNALANYESGNMAHVEGVSAMEIRITSRAF
jgi:hypothetical protein